ncbi:MAG: hypothetical protein A7316_00670 [Candidatus Altiarchaeales archaeon WOR_SM1_86-2]|nr:MAG: hypothetical protein A7316_00670 [Candidatus Altiarchaeales archaeon WOR_SM1_86-2]
MSDLKIEVFTSPTCPHCPSAVRATREVLNENPELKRRIEWREMNTVKPNARRKARSHGIRGVPTIILTNTKTGETAGITGTPCKKRYLEVIYETIGEKPPDTKEGKKEDKSNESSFVDRYLHLFE